MTSSFHSADETVQALHDASAYPGCFGTAVEDMEVGGRFRTRPDQPYRVITGISQRPNLEAVFLHWSTPNGDGMARNWPKGTRLDYLPACGLEIDDGASCGGTEDHPEPCREVEP